MYILFKSQKRLSTYGEQSFFNACVCLFLFSEYLFNNFHREHEVELGFSFLVMHVIGFCLLIHEWRRGGTSNEQKGWERAVERVLLAAISRIYGSISNAGLNTSSIRKWMMILSIIIGAAVILFLAQFLVIHCVKSIAPGRWPGAVFPIHPA